jgi:hypothetical protein
MIDLRPYVGRLDWKVGIGTDHIYDASYPYLIQANYRAGYFTHYAGAGTVKSLRVSYGEEVVDLCLERCMASYHKEDGDTIVETTPVTIDFSDFSFDLKSIFRFKKDSGEIIITRKILSDLKGKEVMFDEYFTGAFGTTEYQSDMTKIKLELTNSKETKGIGFAYKCRTIDLNNCDKVSAIIPDVNTIVEMSGDNDFGEFEEGHAFSPSYRLSLKKVLKEGEMVTCLKLKKVA